jgi:hypothetical protein
MKNTLIIKNIVLYYQSCGVKVSKNKVERLSDVGVWPVNPSMVYALKDLPAALSTNIKPLSAMKRNRTEKLGLVVTKDEAIREVSRTCGLGWRGRTG